MARGDYPSSKAEQYIVRFPQGMRERIKARAAENMRSMNSEIVLMLQRGLETETAGEPVKAAPTV